MTSGGELTGPTILPPALRRPAGTAAVLAGLVFVTFAARYRGGSSARWLDRRVQDIVGSPDAPHVIPQLVIGFGDEASVAMLALLLSGLSLALGHRRLALLAIIGPGLTGLATELAKPLIGRTMDGDLAFPSGHTAGATALGIVGTLLLASLTRAAPGTSAVLLVTGTVASGGIMAFALVAEQAHYPTDTVGGFCLAVTLLIASALAIERWAERSDERMRRP